VRKLLVLASVLALGCGSRGAPLPERVPVIGAAESAAAPPSGPTATPVPPAKPSAVLSCDAASCSYDAATMRCVDGAGGKGTHEGPTCACGAGAQGCVVAGFQGKVPCTKSDECSCTSGYSPAPAKLFPRGLDREATATTGARPGDCIATCRAGRCDATQAPM